MMHKLTVIGNVGRKPELKYSQGGKPYASFSLFSTERWTGRDGQKNEKTIRFSVVAWNRLAETCAQYLNKGDLIYVEGTLVADKETGGPSIFTKQDGSPAANFRLQPNLVKFLKLNGGDQSDAYQDELDNDIPF